MKALTAVFLCAALLGAGGFWLWETWPLGEVRVARVDRTTVVQVLSEEGIVKPRTEVLVPAEAEGRLARLCVKEGARVKRGAPLAEIDSDYLKAEVRQYEAELNAMQRALDSWRESLAEAEARLKLKEKEHARRKKLYEKGVISVEEYDLAATELEVAERQRDSARSHILQAQADIGRAEATLEAAKVKLSKARIIAPINGLVVDIPVKAGEYLRQGQTVVHLVDDGGMFIEVEIAEADMGEVHVGQRAMISADAYPARTFAGRIVRIDPRSRLKGSVIEVKRSGEEKVFRAAVKFEDPKRLLKAGMVVYVDLVTMEKEDVPAVPREAVLTEEGAYIVYVLAGRRAWKRHIELGARGVDLVEVRQGVQPGELVILSRLDKIYDGARVLPKAASPKP